MNFQEQGIIKEEWMNTVDRLTYAAYEDQCSLANPRVLLVENMKQILIDSFNIEEFLDK